MGDALQGIAMGLANQYPMADESFVPRQQVPQSLPQQPRLDLSQLQNNRMKSLFTGKDLYTDVEGLKSRLKDPLKPYAADFIRVGKESNIDPALLAAIAALETGHGTSSAFKRGNMMGISDSKSALPFENGPVASLETQVKKLLTMDAYNKARETQDPELAMTALHNVYSPPPKNGVPVANDLNNTNQGWKKDVMSLYNKYRGEV